MIKSIPIPVSELMSRDLVVLQPEDSLQEVEQCFRAYNIHHIPVIGESGQLRGLVTRSDFSRASHLLVHFRQDFKEVLVRDIMTQQLATTTPDTQVHHVAEVFLSNIMHAMPVVDGDTLVGIITTQDLLRYLLEERKQLTE
ncbi:MAG: CBS domain-containing protein [Phaeodactylibacter sp.]|uniref:CBS domain-containing protein n=1 Tax=Phaeodactylibacter sp. TaxID=1940289 RepID=UPI0032EF3198